MGHPAVMPAPPDSTLEAKLKYLRELGWTITVHNDYRQRGVLHTFWLFTCSGRSVQAEGPADQEVEVVDSVLRQVYDIELEKKRKKMNWSSRWFHKAQASTPEQAEAMVNGYADHHD